MKLLSLIVTEDGQALTEFVLILGAIAAAVVGTIMYLGPQITSLFTEFEGQVN